MNDKMSVVIAVITVVCLMSAMFAFKSYSKPIYDPWLDTNDDNIMDVSDVQAVVGAYGSFGQNITKAQVLYDSGWLNITDEQGKFFDVTHNLGISDWNNQNIIVEYTGRTTVDAPIIRSGTTTGFNKTEVTRLNDRALSVVQTADGGYAFTGYILDPDYKHYLTWAKTNSSGDLIVNSYWGSNPGPDTVGTSIIQLGDGSYMIGGWANWTGAGSHDAWLAKLDSGGDMLWNKTYGGAYDDYVYSVIQTSDGGFALAGSTQSYPGGCECYLVKTDSNGNMQWSNHYGGSNWDEAKSIMQTGDGGYALAGYTFSYGAGQTDFYLVKTDSSGNMMWNKTYGGTGYDWCYSGVQTSDGGYALAGPTNSFGSGYYVFYLVKTNAAGSMQWNRTYGATSDEIANSVIQTRDGGYAIAGLTTSFGSRVGDFHFVKTNDLGNMLWTKTIGGSDFDTANWLIQAKDGGYVMVGYGYSTQILGTGNYPYLIKLAMPTLCVSCITYGKNALTFYRDSADTQWNYLRVQIIKRK
jgi:hypothetical protein